MKQASLSWHATRFAPRFEHHMPRCMNNDWLARQVDPPRFGWDIPTLDIGFTQPLYRFIDGQPLHAADAPMSTDGRFLRAALCSALVEALPGGAGLDPLSFDMEMTALELHAVASTMLDHLDNGRDIASSRGRETALALPVLITVAYSARQLAASMVWGPSTVAPDRIDTLRQRFGRLLMLQGIGHTLDLWGGENQLRHAGVDALAEYMRWYVAPLDFELPCELAAAASGLASGDTAMLVRAGGELGLAWHAALALARLDGEVSSSAPALRWNCLDGVSLREALSAILLQSRQAALAGARQVAPAVAQVFESFLDETLSRNVTDVRSPLEAF